jgi:hypothetical protein
MTHYSMASSITCFFFLTAKQVLTSSTGVLSSDHVTQLYAQLLAYYLFHTVQSLQVI